jgi:hypothetical protein
MIVHLGPVSSDVQIAHSESSVGGQCHIPAHSERRK